MTFQSVELAIRETWLRDVSDNELLLVECFGKDHPLTTYVFWSNDPADCTLVPGPANNTQTRQWLDQHPACQKRTIVVRSKEFRTSDDVS